MTTATRIARVPYLNSVPFYSGLPLGDHAELTDCVPRELGVQAAAGGIAAGPLPLADYVRLEQTFERLGRLGIAVRGRAHSAILFARRPLRQLDGALIALTQQSSTTVCVLRLILEQRYGMTPASYLSGSRPDADAILLIGDEALTFAQTNRTYPYEIDVAFEWWLWQHLPCVFAVWAIRKDVAADEKKRLKMALTGTLAINLRRLGELAKAAAPALGVPQEKLEAYLSNFVYRFSVPEEEAITRFRALADAHGLL